MKLPNFIGILLLGILLPLLSLYFVINQSGIYTENGWEIFQSVKYAQELRIEMSGAEVMHLNDVSGLFTYLNYLMVFGVSLFFLLWPYLRTKKRVVIFGSILSVSFFSIVFLVAYLNFEFIFELFHRVFFPQGNYAFSLDSVLKTNFSNEWFLNLFGLWFGAHLILSSLIIFLSKLYCARICHNF